MPDVESRINDEARMNLKGVCAIRRGVLRKGPTIIGDPDIPDFVLVNRRGSD